MITTNQEATDTATERINENDNDLFFGNFDEDIEVNIIGQVMNVLTIFQKNIFLLQA